jgi:hypothetical protein
MTAKTQRERGESSQHALAHGTGEDGSFDDPDHGLQSDNKIYNKTGEYRPMIRLNCQFLALLATKPTLALLPSRY